MGSDKAEKEQAKIEKKRLKAQLKAEKARAKAAEPSQKLRDTKPAPVQQPQIIINMPSKPWWKDPRWISAIIGAISLSLAMIAYFTDLL